MTENVWWCDPVKNTSAGGELLYEKHDEHVDDVNLANTYYRNGFWCRREQNIPLLSPHYESHSYHSYVKFPMPENPDGTFVSATLYLRAFDGDMLVGEDVSANTVDVYYKINGDILYNDFPYAIVDEGDYSYNDWVLAGSFSTPMSDMIVQVGSNFGNHPEWYGIDVTSAITSNMTLNWLGTWAHRVTLKVDGGKIRSTLTNYPIGVFINNSSGIINTDLTAIFDELTSDANRKKIAVTTVDGTTQCYVEIEKWDDANEKASLWVRIPTVASGASNITTLYLYYDVNKDDNTTYVGDTGSAPAQAVWDSNFTAVYHFGQSVNGTDNEFKDSTANGLHGKAYRYNAGMSYPQLQTGIGEGYALQFYNDDYYANGWLHCIMIPDNDAFSRSVENEQLHISYWINPTTLNIHTYSSTYVRMLLKTNAVTGLEWTHVFRNTGGVVTYAWNDATGKDYGLNITPLTAGRPAGLWRFVNHALGYDAVPDETWGKGGQKAWINGTDTWTYDTDWTDYRMADGEYTKRYMTGNATGYYMCDTDGTDCGYYEVTNTASPVLVGAGGYDSGQGYLYGFTGRIDELRFSKIIRSEAWINADYYSGQDFLISYSFQDTPNINSEIAFRISPSSDAPPDWDFDSNPTGYNEHFWVSFVGPLGVSVQEPPPGKTGYAHATPWLKMVYSGGDAQQEPGEPTPSGGITWQTENYITCIAADPKARVAIVGTAHGSLYVTYSGGDNWYKIYELGVG